MPHLAVTKSNCSSMSNCTFKLIITNFHRDLACGSGSFKQFLIRQSCFVSTNVTSALEVYLNALYKFTFDSYLPTYLL